MRKLLPLFVLIILLSFNVVAWTPAGVNVQDIESFRESVVKVNGGSMLSFLCISGLCGTAGGYGTAGCNLYGFLYPYNCDNACNDGLVASNCFYFPGVSTLPISIWDPDCITLSGCYKKDIWVSKQCYCSQPTSTCLGGYEPTQRKCDGTNLWECKTGGFFEFVTNCANGCLNGACLSSGTTPVTPASCIPHSTKQCSSGSVYWYNSCNVREEISESCSEDETCQNAVCVEGGCTEDWIGLPKCFAGEGDTEIVKMQWKRTDCTIEWRDREECSGACESGKCEDGGSEDGGTVDDEGNKAENCLEVCDEHSQSECIAGKITDIVYECSADTSWKCKEMKIEYNCECSKDSECDDDETCEDSICSSIDCEDGTINSHQCLKPTNLWGWVILIISVVVIIGGLSYFASGFSR